MLGWLPLVAVVLGADAPDVYDRVLQYRRMHLEVRPLAHTTWVTPLAINMDSARYLDNDPSRHDAVPQLMPVDTNAGEDWGIVRGAADVLDDMDLAELLHDDRLAARIEHERYWPELWWRVGFGAASVVSVGTGAYLTWGHYGSSQAQQNGQAIGVSLLAVGGAAALLAILFPNYADHVLTPHEAAERCDQYNANLREELQIEPEDLQRF